MKMEQLKSKTTIVERLILRVYKPSRSETLKKLTERLFYLYWVISGKKEKVNSRKI